MSLTFDDLFKMMEDEALHCEELASKEDAKPVTAKNLSRIYGAHMAARSLRALIGQAKEKLEEEATR